MKKVLLATALLASAAVYAQKKPAKTAAKTAASPLKTKNDSLSYAFGVYAASEAQSSDWKVNPAMMAKAIMDVQAKKTTLIDKDQAQFFLYQQQQTGRAKAAVDEGKRFLAENKNKPGIKTTASGLQYEVLTEGTGPMPRAIDTVTANYRGTLINGREFDASSRHGGPISFPLNGVIKGWTEGLQLMHVGSKYRFFIPQELGYGLYGAGQDIPGGSTLIFEVELVDVKPKK
ncbi:MAG: FKBP-type peptidyl-prolyl cis-trans isomerase [Sphingobacteriales bacterium]|nr:MAG: FKBP-type peptidyl-prolyl cis-trans isomerase [Sphingobacteriales bacterium]